MRTFLLCQHDRVVDRLTQTFTRLGASRNMGILISYSESENATVMYLNVNHLTMTSLQQWKILEVTKIPSIEFNKIDSL